MRGEEQRRARQVLQRRHEHRSLDFERQVRAFDQVEERELKSLAMTERKEHRVRQRGGHRLMRSIEPALTLELRPRGRRAMLYKAKKRFTSETRRALTQDFEEGQRRQTPLNLTSEFERAAKGGKRGGEEGNGSSDRGQPAGPRPSRSHRPRQRGRGKDNDREH
jgi:hypothetical protein